MKILYFLLPILQLEACKWQKTAADSKDKSLILPAQGIVPNDSGNKTAKQASILSNSLSTFNSNFFEKISQLENGNIMYSPLGLHLGLFQTYLGAPRNSSSRKELKGILELNMDEDIGYLNNYELALATINAEGSGIRVGNNKPEAKSLKITFNAENVTSEDSKSLMEKFNNMVEAVDKMDIILNKTMNGDFFNATGYMGFETSFVITNTIKFQIKEDFAILNNPIFFNGKWKYQFNDPESKSLMIFHVDNSTQTRFVPVKLTENLKLANVEELKADVLELPYQNQQISMIIVLPKNLLTYIKLRRILKIWM